MTAAEWGVFGTLMFYFLTNPSIKWIGFRRFDNARPRDPAFYDEPLRTRALGAHQNGIEAFPFFAVAVLLAEFRAGPQRLINELAILFLIVRIAYVLTYLGDRPMLRSILCSIGFAMHLAVFFMSAIRSHLPVSGATSREVWMSERDIRERTRRWPRLSLRSSGLQGPWIQFSNGHVSTPSLRAQRSNPFFLFGLWIAHMGNGNVKDEESPFGSTAATSSSRPRAVQDDARRSSQGRPFRAAAQRLGLELSEHVIMVGRSDTTGACGVGGSVRASGILAFAIQGSSRYDDLGCLPDQTHIRSSREATAPRFRLRRAGSRRRDHSSLRRLKPCNPSVRPLGSSEADRASADGLWFCVRAAALAAEPGSGSAGRLHHGPLDDDALGDVLPQGHEKLARQRHDRALAALLASLLEPARQGRLRLVTYPQPGDLDHCCPQPRIAGLRHALLVPDASALPGRCRKARIGGDLVAVGEAPIERLRPEHGGEVVFHSLQGEQHRDRIRRSLLARRLSRRRQQSFLRDLYRLDLFQKQLDPIELAADLRLQMRGQLPSVSSTQCFKPLPPVAPQRGVVAALREQKTFDPVHMCDALLDQCPPFAAEPPAIFLLGRGRNHHCADPRLAALVGKKRPQQYLAIKLVRLGPSSPPRRRDRGRINHMALDALLLQNAVQPKPVQPRLMDRDDRIALASSDLRLALEFCKQRQKSGRIACRDALLGHLLALARRQRRHQPIRSAQFQR